MLLHHALSHLRSTQVAVIHCSAQTSSRHVLQKLSQTCLLLSSNTGRVFRPKDCENLVLYLKDINLPKPDKWGTSNLIAFLQQVVQMIFIQQVVKIRNTDKWEYERFLKWIWSMYLLSHFVLFIIVNSLHSVSPFSRYPLQVLTYNGFYNESLEWVTLENIQVVASMSTGRALGSHSITSRFSSIVRICTIEYALQVICKLYYNMPLQIQIALVYLQLITFSSFYAFGYSYPDREQLQTIYSVYLQPVLQRSLGSQALWASTGKAHQLAGSLVELYEQVWT